MLAPDMERTMKAQRVILKAAGKLKWWEAAEIIDALIARDVALA